MRSHRQVQIRRFLFLQGPHGPFFDKLGSSLRQGGHETWRVGFNYGDQFFWKNRNTFVPYTGNTQDWGVFFEDLLDRLKITDVVLYGESRHHHAVARDVAARRGLTLHLFEEGYMRPYWVTYERKGTNGHSPLMDISVQEMARQLDRAANRPPPPPALWGDMRQHIFYSALYHFCVLALNRRYRNFHPHRGIVVAQEFRHYLRRLVLMPVHTARRFLTTRTVLRQALPYHLVLLQLEHDANFLSHSPFGTVSDFIEVCVRSFARGAPAHHRLVFKAHPLEDGRGTQRREIRRLAKKHGVSDRVFYVLGGKLALLLDTAQTATTVNSTAAQQVLWRGLPLKAFGQAVYDKPEFVSTQSLESFFASPEAPDMEAYFTYRHFLLETSQVTGGFYSRAGRETLLRQVTELLLKENDRYETLAKAEFTRGQHLATVT